MQRAFDAVGPTGDEHELAILHEHRAGLFSMLGRYGEALADIAAARRVFTAAADRYGLAVTHWVASTIHERRGDLTAALAERDTELVLLQEIGNIPNAAMAHAARSRLLRALDRVDDSEAAATAARELTRAQGDASFSARVEERLLTMGTTG